MLNSFPLGFLAPFVSFVCARGTRAFINVDFVASKDRPCLKVASFGFFQPEQIILQTWERKKVRIPLKPKSVTPYTWSMEWRQHGDISTSCPSDVIAPAREGQGDHSGVVIGHTWFMAHINYLFSNLEYRTRPTILLSSGKSSGWEIEQSRWDIGYSGSPIHCLNWIFSPEARTLLSQPPQRDHQCHGNSLRNSRERSKSMRSGPGSTRRWSCKPLHISYLGIGGTALTGQRIPSWTIWRHGAGTFHATGRCL